MNSTANAILWFGTTNQFGLSGNLGSASDVFKVVELRGDNRIDDEILINQTYDTIRFENVPNSANDYRVNSKIRLTPQ